MDGRTFFFEEYKSTHLCAFAVVNRALKVGQSYNSFKSYFSFQGHIERLRRLRYEKNNELIKKGIGLSYIIMHKRDECYILQCVHTETKKWEILVLEIETGTIKIIKMSRFIVEFIL